jgi:hypothetical protein
MDREFQMNERIKLLAEQAQKVAYYTDGGYTPIMTLDQEKFAELIVAECSQISRDHQRNYYESHGDRIAKKIKEHFGVKE